MMFSIIMPVWNRAHVVTRAIESALAQTCRDYELIIVDDGSEDNLKDAVGPYLSDSVRYFRRSHIGVSAARNYAIENASGDYIAYLDSDNRWHPEFLSTMKEALSRPGKPHQVAYSSRAIFVRENDTGKPIFDRVQGEHFDYQKLCDSNYIDLNVFVHARSCIDYAGLFDTALHSLVDWDLILRITSYFEPLFIPDVLVDYYFGTEKNCISLKEKHSKPHSIISRKYARHKEPLTLTHDAITYSWEKVSAEKYHNWVRMNNSKLNTQDYTAWGFPYMLQIEPTNMCNLACPLCPCGRKELERDPRHMKLEEFNTIIDDMEPYLLFLVLWDWGEPLMNPDLPEMINYAAERDIRTVTSTNAHFLHNEDFVGKILSSGLDSLIVAIDSHQEENYRAYRQGGSLSRAMEGLRKTIVIKKKLKSRTLINMRMVIMKQNEHELKVMRNLSRSLGVDLFTVKTLNPSCGSTLMDRELLPRNHRYRRYEYDKVTGERIRVDAMCRRVWQMSNIFSNGDLMPCCYDYRGRMKIGNIFDEPLSKLWNGPAYRELREKIFNRKDAIPECRDCTINFKPSWTGWFAEIRDYRKKPFNIEKSLKDLARPCLAIPGVRKVVNLIRRMKKR